MFRKKFLKKKTWSVADSTPVVEMSSHSVMETDEENLTESNHVVYVPIDYTSKECVKSLPDAKEYTLENLLAAGVPLQQLSVSNMLNPTDYATYNSIAESVVSNIDVSKVESK